MITSVTLRFLGTERARRGHGEGTERARRGHGEGTETKSFSSPCPEVNSLRSLSITSPCPLLFVDLFGVEVFFIFVFFAVSILVVQQRKYILNFVKLMNEVEINLTEFSLSKLVFLLLSDLQETFITTTSSFGQDGYSKLVKRLDYS